MKNNPVRREPDHHIVPHAARDLSQPEVELLEALFPGDPLIHALASAPGGWRTLSSFELDALLLNDREKKAVLALQALVRRGYPELPKLIFRDADVVGRVYGERLGGLGHEKMIGLALDGQLRFMAEIELGSGGAHGAALKPVDVLRPLIRIGASAFILLHNHPSGDPTPSTEDLAMTRTLEMIAASIGIPLMDHVIIGGRGGGFTSLYNLGVITDMEGAA